MGILDSIKRSIQERIEQKKQDVEFERKLRLQADIERKQLYEQEYKKAAHEANLAIAKQQAAKATGLQKLRAENRLRRLQENQGGNDTFFSKLSEYTQRNKARTEANLKRTKEMREVAKEMRERKAKERSVGFGFNNGNKFY